MSKKELQRSAQQGSGVSYEESQEVVTMVPSLYDRIGKDGIEHLSQLFYDRVFDDTEAWFKNIFSSSTKEEAVDNQYRFFVQTFGGPDLYREKKGKYTRLVGRHANYSIGVNAARRWLEHMKAAVDEHDMLQEDDEAKEKLKRYFEYTAFYIVAAMAYMRPDQLSGGTTVDSGRIW